MTFHKNHYASVIAGGFQVFLIIIYAIFVRYTPASEFPEGVDRPKFYSYLQEIHVMMFIGFGFLMTFLKRYAYGALGFTYLITVLCIQWDMWCESELSRRTSGR
jgi:ammonium transporter Rh